MPPVTNPVPHAEWTPRTALRQVVRTPTLRHPLRDFGLFGPGSAAWQVWDCPTVLLATFRAAIVQMLQPATAAGVAQSSVYQQDSLGRLRRTLDYFMTVVFGDSRSVVLASEALRQVHDRVTGIEPITGKPYAANDPENQLWVHMTAWHSVLYCYERYGPGPLSPHREADYWRDCRIAAELQVIDPLDVPVTRDGVREYFASVRPRLCVSEPAREIIAWLTAPSSPELSAVKPILVGMGRAAAATLPAHLRDIAGLNSSALQDAAAAVYGRVTYRIFTPRFSQRIFAAMSPEAWAVWQSAVSTNARPDPATHSVTDARTTHLLPRSRPPAAI